MAASDLLRAGLALLEREDKATALDGAGADWHLSVLADEIGPVELRANDELDRIRLEAGRFPLPSSGPGRTALFEFALRANRRLLDGRLGLREEEEGVVLRLRHDLRAVSRPVKPWGRNELLVADSVIAFLDLFRRLFSVAEDEEDSGVLHAVVREQDRLSPQEALAALPHVERYDADEGAPVTRAGGLHSFAVNRRRYRPQMPAFRPVSVSPPARKRASAIPLSTAPPRRRAPRRAPRSALPFERRRIAEVVTAAPSLRLPPERERELAFFALAADQYLDTGAGFAGQLEDESGPIVYRTVAAGGLQEEELIAANRAAFALCLPLLRRVASGMLSGSKALDQLRDALEELADAGYADRPWEAPSLQKVVALASFAPAQEPIRQAPVEEAPEREPIGRRRRAAAITPEHRRAELLTAQNRLREYIKDAYPRDAKRRFGFVVGIDETGTDVRLLVRFAGEDLPRRVALHPVSDGHYLDPDDPKSRYRRLSVFDRNELWRLARRGQSGSARSSAPPRVRRT